jgi:hypothetical protein
LKDCLEKIPSRVLRDGYERINGDGSKLTGAIKRLVHASERMPRDALKKWRDYLAIARSQGLLNALKARELKECLEQIPNRVIKDAYERIVGDGSKVTGVIKRLLHAAHRKPREALKRWRDWV